MQKKGSPERAYRRKIIAKVYERITNKRQNFAHQLSRQFVNNYGSIYIEDLNINRMGVSRGMRRGLRDAAWSTFTTYLEYKAADAGIQIVKVNPAYTSRTCSACGYRLDKALYGRVFECFECGHSEDRDLNASRNILTVGQHGLPRKRQEARVL